MLEFIMTSISENLQLAPVMQGTGGVRKLRFAVGGRGKSNSLRTTRVALTKPKAYTPEEVAKIRTSFSVSQAYFADVLGVSRRTVEAWEHGYNTPSGTAARLLTIAEKQPDVFRGLLMQTTAVE